jgi:hypothetical protein
MLAGREPLRRGNASAAHERAVLTAEILDSHCLAFDDHARMASRHAWEIETDLRVAGTADDIFARRQR